MSLNEFDIINHYFKRQSQQETVIKSIGDDCAILSFPTDKQLVMSMDTVVAGRHFPHDALPYDIATRALCTSLSDLAAMGATPLWFTLGLTLPSSSESWLAQFSQGLFAVADEFSCDLIGGDTTRGPLTVTVQVHGEVEPSSVLRRDTAAVDDDVYISGTLGDGAAALAVLEQRLAVDELADDYLRNRFYRPTPQILIGQQLLGIANAAIDISDGLLADSLHLASSSKVAIDIELDKLPFSSALSHVEQAQRFAWALTGGDDYQLLFTVPQFARADCQLLIEQGQLHACLVGKVRACDEQGHVRCLYHQQPYDIMANHAISDIGYQHFAS